MKIQVRSVSPVKQILAGRKIFVEVADGSSLHDLLKDLTAKYGQEFFDAVCDESGYPENRVAILVNGTHAGVLGGVRVSLRDGDDVLILPVSGGG